MEIFLILMLGKLFWFIFTHGCLMAVFFLSFRDNVEWDDEQQKHAEMAVESNGQITLSKEHIEKYENDADKYWNEFYGIHNNRYILGYIF